MEKEYKVPKRKQPIFKVVKGFFSLFFKCDVVYEEENVPEKAIVLANHSAKSGPMSIEINYPNFNVKWGAHQMLGNYKSRFKYLRDVLYMQKIGKKKFPATIKAFFEAIFSKMLYKGMKFLPTYQDAKLSKTIKNSAKVLDANMSILIFPENSNTGYHDELIEVFGGFILLSDYYYKKTGVDLPVIPVYYHKKSKKIFVGKCSYIQKLKQEGMSRDDICEYYKNEINSLYYKYILNK